MNKNLVIRNSTIPHDKDQILKQIHDIELRIDSNITSYKFYQARLQYISTKNNCLFERSEGSTELNDSYRKTLGLLLNFSAEVVTNQIKTGLAEKANKLRGYFCFTPIRIEISTSIILWFVAFTELILFSDGQQQPKTNTMAKNDLDT